MTYKGVAKGKMIELEEPLPFLDGQAISVSVQAVLEDATVGSRKRIRRVMHEPPKLEQAAVDELDRAIEQGKLPVRPQGVFGAGAR